MIYKLEDYKKFQAKCEADLDEYVKTDFRIIGMKGKIKFAFFKLLGKISKPNNYNGVVDLLKVKRILLLRYDVIGDYIVTTSLINFIKSINPNILIDIVITEKNEILAKNDPNINKYYQVKYSKHYNFNYIKLKHLRKNDYDLIFALISSKITKSALITFFSAPHAIKIASYDSRNKEIYSQFFEILTKDFKGGQTWTQKMLNLGKLNIVNKQADPANESPYIILNKEAIEKINAWTQEYNLSYNPKLDNIRVKNSTLDKLSARQGREYVVINMAGSNEKRVLSKNNIIEIIKPLAIQFPDLLFFLSGGPAFKELNKDIIYELGIENIKLLDLDLLSFMGALIGAKLLISPDTSAVHIAATAGVPEVVMFSSEGLLYEWYPYNTKFIPLLADKDENVNSIPSEEVISSANILLNNIDSDLIFNLNEQKNT